jgi:two-component system sensor histidine kinase/response regulator
VTLLDLEASEMDSMSLAQEIKRDPAIEGVRVALITSSTRSGEAEAGAAVYLTMPVRRAFLHDRLVEIVEPGHLRDPEDMVGDQPSTEQTKTSRPLILVVEDNPVNQEVAVRLLENMGFRADVAANGREAVEAVFREPHAAILMDCQMPEMDGYEATRRIREMAGAASKTPIIAITAEAMERDEKRARAAGMDDYLSKPVQWEQLAAVVDRWVSVNRTADGLEEQPAGERAQDHVIDVEVLASLQKLEAQGRDIGPGDLVKEFTETAASTLEDLRRFVGRGDGKRTAFAAHRLKGSVGSLGARRMADMCAEVERLAADDELAGAADMLARIEQEFDRVCLALGAGFKQLSRR